MSPSPVPDGREREQPTPPVTTGRRGLGVRGRLALLLLVMLVPLAVALVLVQRHWEMRTAALAIGEATAERLDERRLARCEADPATFGSRLGRGRGRPRFRRPRPPGRGAMRVYDERLRPAVAGSPAIDEAMAAELESEGIAWRRAPSRDDRGALEVAIRVRESGPCSVVLVTRPAAPFGTPLWPALVFALLAIGAASIAAGPLVRRVRRLTEAVLRARREGADFAPDPSGDEVGELSRAFAADRAELARQNEALERRERALTRFVANTTHDVGIPLTVLQGHLVTLRKQLAQGPGAEVVGHALEEAHYIGALMRNLAAASKLEDPERVLERAPVDLVGVVERVIARHAPLARSKAIALDHAVPDHPVSLSGDITLLEQAVGNLVHNAVRYNGPGGHVAVILEVDGERVQIRVADDGPGVAADELPRLAERRFRSDEARSRQPTGTGLGLAIARDVAERHGLQLSFASAEPHGLIATLEGSLR